MAFMATSDVRFWHCSTASRTVQFDWGARPNALVAMAFRTSQQWSHVGRHHQAFTINSVHDLVNTATLHVKMIPLSNNASIC